MHCPALVTTVAMFLAVSACGSSSGPGANQPGPLGRYEGRKIVKVSIEGNEAVGDSAIESGLATRGPQGLIFKEHTRFDPIEAHVDRERIEAFYAREGFFSAEVIDVEVRRVADGVEVAFHVEEGAPSKVPDIDIEGAPRELQDELGDRVEVEEGETFEHDAYLESKRRLERTMLQHGYAHAEIAGQVLVDRPAATANVTYNLDPGPVVRFGETRVEDSGRIPKSAVLNRIEWEPGQKFDPELIEHTRGRLLTLDHFSGVRIEYDREGRPEVTDMVIRTSPAHRKELRAGVGVGADNLHWELRARGGYKLRGALDPLTTLDIDLRPAYTFFRDTNTPAGPGGEARVTLTRPDFVLPLVTGKAEAWYRITELIAYDSRGPGGRLSLGRGFFSDALFVGTSYEIKRLTFRELHPQLDMTETAESIGLVEPYRVAFFDQRAALDGRDDLLDPHSGYFLEVRAEESGPYAGSNFDYIKTSAEARGYLPLGDRLVAAARLTAGGTPQGSPPITERFYSGGASSHRGFPQRRLSPFVSDEEAGEAPIGGSAMAETSAELRYDLTKLRGSWLGVVGFVDGGDVVRGPVSDIEPSNLHWASGLGLRYDTLVGPLRFDVGYRLNRTGAGEPLAGDRFAFHLSLGEAF